MACCFTSYQIGDMVQLSHQRIAIIRYIGQILHFDGIWYGVEYIDGSLGAGSGMVNGIRYFDGENQRCDIISLNLSFWYLQNKKESNWFMFTFIK